MSEWNLQPVPEMERGEIVLIRRPKSQADVLPRYQLFTSLGVGLWIADVDIQDFKDEDGVDIDLEWCRFDPNKISQFVAGFKSV